MDDKGKITVCRKHVVYLALSTRLAVITLQFVSNIFLFDHEADAFQSPKEPTNVTLFDRITDTFLGGFLRWDAQYFYHVAKYGYTFENTVAFFPLYPYLTKFIAIPIMTIFPFLDWDSIALIIFVILNIFFFVQAALALYDLSSIILNRKIAYRATILFCVNPASVFFVAPYTESLFSFLSFSAMLKCVEIYYKNAQSKSFSSFINMTSISIPIALSIATRSNGILNIGFLLYFWMAFFKKTYWPHNIATLINLFKYASSLTLNIVICIFPFIVIQSISYHQFCKDFEQDVPKHLVTFGNKNNLILPGTFSKHNQTWCWNLIPLAYSYVQNHYWNVGFLKYYELKQIPNFLLAAPIIFIIVSKSIIFIKQHWNYCLKLGLTVQNKDDLPNSMFDNKMFVFVCHALILTLFCVFCVHIQVTTRMLCSASPVLYWFCAYAFDSVGSVEYDLLTTWKCFLLTNELTLEQKLIKYYFFTYFCIGTILFSNNYPWT